MTWNYRIIDFGKDGCAMHEVHYDKRGKIMGRTLLRCTIWGDKPSELIKDLEMMLADAKRLPPLKIKELPKACR